MASLIRRLEHDLLHPVPVPDNLNAFPWIPFQDGELADSRINRDLKGSIPDVQDLLQSLLHFTSELIIFCNALPQLPLPVIIRKVKVIHIIQDNA